MEYTTLGRTGLRVSVAGLGCGGNSRLGQGTGKSVAESVRIVRLAYEAGVTFFDTAAAYGTEEIVGEAVREIGREQCVISTKSLIKDGVGANARLRSEAEVVASLEQSLTRLKTDYVDVFHLHAVLPETYEHAREVIVPGLDKARAEGKFRFLGITESPPRDPGQVMIQRALADSCWSVAMIGFHMLNQKAREQVFPVTRREGVGTLLMFVVRNIFSQPGLLEETIARLQREGQLPADLDPANALQFLIDSSDGAESIADAAYRYARHEPGADVVLFGTGNPAHIKANIRSISRPPLPQANQQQLARLFGNLQGVGLDLPDRVK